MDPLPALPVLAGAVAYERRARTLRAGGRPVPLRRRVFVWTGCVALVVGLLLPDEPFAVHMAQHLLLSDIGALLVVLGLTGAILRPLLAVRALRGLRVLAHPAIALPLWAVTFVTWHLDGPYNASLEHPLLHAAEHFSLFLVGALMWAAVVEPLPGPAWFGTGWKAAYTLAVRAVGMAIALAFIWGDPDKRVGGLIMFVEGGLVTLIVFGWLFLRWQAEAERRQQLIEQGYDSTTARRAARHWPRLQQPPGRARSGPSPAARDTPSERRST